MELDNLKNSWNGVSIDLNHHQFDIISAMKKEIQSPLTALKKKSRSQIRILPILFGFLVVMAAKIPALNHHFLIWMALIIIPLTTFYYYFNIKLINEMESYNGSVKENIQSKATKLVRSHNLYLIFTRVAIVLTVIVFEVIIQSDKFGLIPGLEILKVIILPLRLLIYGGIIGVHYLLSKYSFNLYFGRYLNRLKEVLAEME